jgi:hypothetical protein
MVWLRAIFGERTLGRLTLLLVLAMVVAYFWPFLSPVNNASWITGGNGVVFGKHGILIGSGPLRPDDIAKSGCTLDLWVEPAQSDAKGAILATFSAANPRLLRVEQFRDGLAVRSAAPGDPVRTGGAQLYADRVFVPGKPALLTITSNGWGTKAFVNGIFRRAAPDFRICHALLTGTLVAGTAADSDFGWRGRLSGIAIFSHLLSPPIAGQQPGQSTTGTAVSHGLKTTISGTSYFPDIVTGSQKSDNCSNLRHRHGTACKSPWVLAEGQVSRQDLALFFFSNQHSWSRRCSLRASTRL